MSGGQLHLPTNDLEIDAAAATSVGPINILGQDLPALGTNWTVETQFTAQYRGGWQNIGLVVWNGDNNFIRSTLTHSLSSSAIYVESSKDNPATTEGTRATAGGNRNILATNTGPVTIKMRYMRVERRQHASRRTTRSWRRRPPRTPTGSRSRARRRRSAT